MSRSENMLKIQVRLGQCILKCVVAPLQCFCLLTQGRATSQPSPMKISNEKIVIFNSFLRIKVEDSNSNQKCSISLYSRSENGPIFIGKAQLSLSQEKCGKVRKYPIKNQGRVVATIEASLYLFYFDHSLPLLQKNMNEISSKIHYSTDNQELSFQKTIKREQIQFQKVKSKTKNNEKHKNLSITKEISLKVKQQNEKIQIAQNLMVKLFEQIGRKNEQIQKRDAQINQKGSLIEHIKVKEMLIQNQSRKINRLKSQARFILAANQELIRHDNQYDEQYYSMKQQKQLMQSKMAVMNSQASLKLMCLKAQLQKTNKQIQRKQVIIKNTINQIQNATKILNVLKHQNKQKGMIIQNLKRQIKNPYVKVQNEQSKQSKKKINIFEILTQQFDNKRLQSQENIQTLPSDLIKEVRVNKKFNSFEQRRCKTLQIAKPLYFKHNKQQSKQKFRGNKANHEKNQSQIPNILEYIMSLSSNIQSKI